MPEQCAGVEEARDFAEIEGPLLEKFPGHFHCPFGFPIDEK
jgi:hypothetical protein